MTLYLKYRPQTVGELDSAEVRGILAKALATGNIPHAWLFSGPRGTGKTSGARVLAKYINCTAKTDQKPCNKCEMCRAITAGSAVDIAEIDAASNRGIDEIRELREKVRLAPMKAQYKVYIIDEVHMLTTEAANALLKTLEEPPEKTIFILCTTDPTKLPETVISRCTRVVFPKPKVDEVVDKLVRVAKGERQNFTKDELTAIAHAGKGSFRDAIKLFEQVVMSGGDVAGVVGAASGGEAIKLMELVEAGKGQEALDLISDMDKKGENFRGVVEVLVEQLRERLLARAHEGSVEREISWIEQLGRVYEQMKTAAVVQLPLEIWVIQNTTENSKPQIANSKRDITLSDPPLNLRGGSNVEVKKETVKPSGKGKYKLEDLAGKWPEVMKAVRPKNHSVEALLRSTKPMGFDGERIELEVFYKFHKDKLETEKCRTIVEEAVEQVFGETGVKLYLRLGQRSQKAAEEITASGVTDEVIKAAEEIFGAQAI